MLTLLGTSPVSSSLFGCGGISRKVDSSIQRETYTSWYHSLVATAASICVSSPLSTAPVHVYFLSRSIVFFVTGSTKAYSLLVGHDVTPLLWGGSEYKPYGFPSHTSPYCFSIFCTLFRHAFLRPEYPRRRPPRVPGSLGLRVKPCPYSYAIVVSFVLCCACMSLFVFIPAYSVRCAGHDGVHEEGRLDGVDEGCVG